MYCFVFYNKSRVIGNLASLIWSMRRSHHNSFSKFAEPLNIELSEWSLTESLQEDNITNQCRNVKYVLNHAQATVQPNGSDLSTKKLTSNYIPNKSKSSAEIGRRREAYFCWFWTPSLAKRWHYINYFIKECVLHWFFISIDKVNPATTVWKRQLHYKPNTSIWFFSNPIC